MTAKAEKERKDREKSQTEGKAELARLLEEHKSKVEKAKKENRSSEADYIKTRDEQLSKGKDWERVNYFVSSGADSHSSRDTTRMLEVITSMKHSS